MTRTRWMTIAAGMTAGLLAGSAVGSSCPDDHKDHEHKDHEHAGQVHIEHVNAAPEHAHSQSAFEVVNVENGDRYEIIVRDGETTALVNGIRVADELVTTKNGKVKILSDDGSVLKELAIASPRAPRLPRAPRAVGAQTAPQVWRFGVPSPAEEAERAIALERPPVMLGVLLDGPSEALQAQLGVSEYAIVIEKVMDGLPADKAGLRQWDIIVEVDGDEIDGEGFLRDILMESEPGDDLDLVVIRKGEAIDLELELVAYDSNMLGTPSAAITIEGRAAEPSRPGFFGSTGEPGRTFAWGQRGGEEAQRAIEDAMRQIEELGILRNNEEASKKLREQIQRMERELSTQAEELSRSRAFTLRGGKLIIDEDEAERAAEEIEERLEDLEDQLEDRLEALEERLEERWERMEDVFDRMLDRFEDMLEKSRDDRE